uniref:Uncharacterized protein n=1 Tax=Moniliophthora roreri TaxID=221103 RepID=A0A0W0FND3_MONRR
MSSQIPEELSDFFSVENEIVMPISTLSAMYFVYGFYVLIFGSCVFTMRARQRSEDRLNGNLYLSLATILFILCTVVVVSRTIVTVRQSITYFTSLKTGDYEASITYLVHDTEKTVTFGLEVICNVLLNITADCMLIHRCYVIWSFKKRVAVPLIILSVATNAIGLISTFMMAIGKSDMTNESKVAIFFVANDIFTAYSISSVVINMLLTLITAGRIWWIHRQVRAQGVYASDTLVGSVSRIILESGIIYPICMIAVLIVAYIPGNTTPFDPSPVAALAAGLAPTLILVRAKLGKTVESLQDKVSDMRFTSPGLRETTTTISQAQAHPIANLSLVPHDIERSGGSEEKSSTEKEAIDV